MTGGDIIGITLALLSLGVMLTLTVRFLLPPGTEAYQTGRSKSLELTGAQKLRKRIRGRKSGRRILHWKPRMWGEGWWSNDFFPRLGLRRSGRDGSWILPSENRDEIEGKGCGFISLAFAIGSIGALLTLLTNHTPLGEDAKLAAATVAYAILAWLSFLLTRAIRNDFDRKKGTIVELSDEPLLPGQEAELRVYRNEKFPFKGMAVYLVLYEETREERDNQSAATKKKIVLKKRIARFKYRQCQSDEPIHRSSFSIPDRAMHSLESRHSKLSWKIILRIKESNKRTYTMAYNFRVAPQLLPDTEDVA
ncbi:hypothetical protein KQI84_13595 [bacterium]|nr:hypothetical protein [bacterium]